MVTASKQTASTTADIKSQFIIFPDWSIGQAGKINHDIFCVFGAHCNCEEYSVEPGPVGNNRKTPSPHTEFYKTNTPNVTSHEQGGEATKGRKSLRPQRVGCREREREIWAAPPPAEALGSPHPILPPPPSLLTGRCTSLVDTLPSSSRGRGRPPFGVAPLAWFS